jgi:hypothetical protein
MIELYINQSSKIQQMNVQYIKKIFAPALQSPCRPWPSSRNTMAAAKTASTLAMAVNTGSKGTAAVPLPLLQQTTGAKKITDQTGALPKKCI